MKKISIEILKNNVLVENSANYFKSMKSAIDFCKNYLIDNDEKFYVTRFHGDAWEYNKKLTEYVNGTKFY